MNANFVKHVVDDLVNYESLKQNWARGWTLRGSSVRADPQWIITTGEHDSPMNKLNNIWRSHTSTNHKTSPKSEYWKCVMVKRRGVGKGGGGVVMLFMHKQITTKISIISEEIMRRHDIGLYYVHIILVKIATLNLTI